MSRPNGKWRYAGFHEQTDFMEVMHRSDMIVWVSPDNIYFGAANPPKYDPWTGKPLTHDDFAPCDDETPPTIKDCDAWLPDGTPR
jgi:hypothetical protein